MRILRPLDRYVFSEFLDALRANVAKVGRWVGFHSERRHRTA